MPAWSVLLYAVLFLFLATVPLKPDTTNAFDLCMFRGLGVDR